MDESVDEAVIGAGHAGLNAIKEIRKTTDNYVLVNGGGLGTTCARVGCMPFKIAVHLAETYQARGHFGRMGVAGAEHLRLDQAAALEHVRDLRDTFVDLVLANTTDEMGEDHLIQGYVGVPMNRIGVPAHDPETPRVGNLPVFLTGDATGEAANLQRAAEQGRVAGRNATRVSITRSRRKTPMASVCSDPNIASVGAQWSQLDEAQTAVSQVPFRPVGRALIMGQNRGLLRV
jgi:pyruvate/2-oxoglutarate dehydrogenase complex dihydrolipoamide dehydrogenase (E3) component